MTTGWKILVLVSLLIGLANGILMGRIMDLTDQAWSAQIKLNDIFIIHTAKAK